MVKDRGRVPNGDIVEGQPMPLCRSEHRRLPSQPSKCSSTIARELFLLRVLQMFRSGPSKGGRRLKRENTPSAITCMQPHRQASAIDAARRVSCSSSIWCCQLSGKEFNDTILSLFSLNSRREDVYIQFLWRCWWISRCFGVQQRADMVWRAT